MAQTRNSLGQEIPDRHTHRLKYTQTLTRHFGDYICKRAQQKWRIYCYSIAIFKLAEVPMLHTALFCKGLSRSLLSTVYRAPGTTYLRYCMQKIVGVLE